MIPTNIIVIGASSVYGRTDPEGGGFVTRFKRWHEQQGAQNAVYNLGISGDTVPGMVARILPEARLRKPDLIIILTGIVDTCRTGSVTAQCRTHREDYEEGLEELVNRGKTLAPIAFISPFPIDETRTTPIAGEESYFLSADADDYVEIQRHICANHRLPFLDIYQLFKNEPKDSYLAADGFHCNANGHQRLCDALIAFLCDLYTSTS